MADILNETMPVVGVGDLSDSERYDSDTERPELSSTSEKKSSTEFTSTTSSSSSASNYSSSYANSSPVSHQAVVKIPNTFNKEVMEKLESLYNSPYQNELTNNQRALNGNKSSTLKPNKSKPEPTPRLRFAPPPPPQPTNNTAMLDSISESISSESNNTKLANLNLTNKNGRFLHDSGFSRRRINSETCLTKFDNDRTANSAPADMNQHSDKQAETTTKSKSISNLCTILAPIPENSINQYDESSSTSTGTRCNSQIGSFAPNSTSITTASCSSGSTVSHHQSSLELFRKNLNRTNISHRFAFNPGQSLVGKQIGGNPGRSTLPGHVTGHNNYSFGGSLCHLSGISSSVNSTLTQEEMLRVRYLTYGTSAQLRQEYDKFLPWPSLTEFRLRRKFRRFKRRARKLLGTSSLLSRIQTVRRLVKIRSRSSTSTSSSSLRNQTQLSSQNSQTLPASAPTPAPSPLDQNVSRSSSLTSLLNLIEEANKNLINSFNNPTPKLNDRPQCPPRLKRAMSSVNISSTKALSKGGTLQRNSSGVQKTCPLGPKMLTTNKDLNNNQNIDKLWNSRMLPDSYQIAFIDQMMQKPCKNNVQKKTATLKPNGSGAVATTTTTTTTTADQNDSDTISVKSLESYFGSGAPMPVSGPSPKTGKSGPGQNSKVLRVRSHFQINNGTVYLEDSDWEMCSEIDSGGFADDGGPESIKSNSVDESGSNHNLDMGTIGLVASPRQSLEVQPVKPGTPVEPKLESASVSTNDSSIEGAQVDKVNNIEQVEIKDNKVLDPEEDEEDEDEKDDIEDSKLSTIKHVSSNQIKKQFQEMAAHTQENNNNNNVNNKPVIKPKPKILVPVVTNNKSASVVCPSHNSKPKGPAARPKVSAAAAVVRRPIKKMAPKAPPSKQNLDTHQDGATGNKSKQSLYHKNCCKSKHAQTQQTPSQQAAPVAATSASLSKHQSSNNQSKDTIGAHKKIDTSNSNSQSNNCSHSCASRNIDNDKVSQNQKVSNVPKSSINNSKLAKPAKLPQVKTKISKISMMKTNLLSKTSSSATNKPRQQQQKQQQKQQSSTTKQKNKTTEDKKSTKSTSVATASKSSSSSHGQMALIDRIANRFMMNKNKYNAAVLNNSNDTSKTDANQSKQASLPCIDEHLNDDADSSNNNKEDCPIIPIIEDSKSNFVPVTESDNLQLPPITTGSIAVEETTKACHLDKNSDLESSSESNTKVEITATDSSNVTNVQMEENLTKSQTNVLELIDKFNNLSKQSPSSENDNLNPIVSNQDGLFRSILTNNNNNNQNSQNSQPNLNLEGQFEQYFNQFYQSSQLPSTSTSNSASTTNTNSDKNNRDDINSFCSRLIQDLESKFNQRLVIKPMSETVSEPAAAVPSRFAISNHNGNNFQNDANLLLLFFLYNQRQMLQEILHQMLTSSAQNRNQPEQEPNKNVVNSSKNVSSGITISSSSVDSDTNSGTKQSKSEAQLSEFNRLIQLLQTSLKQQQQINENIKVLDSSKTIDPKLAVKEQEQNSQENIPKTADPTNETNADFNNNSKSKEFNANVNCSGSNRFVNKIVLNNSINQYNFNMNSADSPPPVAAAPSIVNVINDNSVNCAANLFDVNISGQSTTTNDDSQYCSDSDYTDYGVVSVNVPESSSGNSLRPVTNPGGGQHRTVLEIKNPSNKFGGLFSTLRYQLEKKRNKNRMQRLKKKDLAKADSLTTALENSNRNGGGQGSGVTVANTSTLEIKGIVAECQAAEQRLQTSSKENSKVGGTLRRLLSPSRDGARSAIGGSFGGSTTSFSNSSSSKLKSSGSIMEISNPNPIGLESMFGTIRRQDQRNPSKPKFPINQAFGNQRSRSEMNFRSIIKLNDQEEPAEEEEEEDDYDDCQSASLYDSIGNQSDCSTIYDRIDGRRMERQRNEPTSHRFRSHLEIRPQPRVPNHPNLLSHPVGRTSSNGRTIYYGSQINLSGSKDHHSAGGQRYRAKPVVTFTLPRSFKSHKQSSSSSSNRPNMANLAGRFEHHQRRFIMDHQEEEEEEDEEDQFDGHQRGHYEDDCDGQHGPGCDTPTQQSCTESSDSSDPESDRTIMSSDRNRVRRQPHPQQQQEQQQPRRRQQLYLPPKSPDESIDDECEYFLTPCKLNERYFRSRNRYR